MHHTDDSFRSLLLSLSRDLHLLLSQTLELAHAEMNAALRSVIRYAGVAVAALVVAIGGLLVLVSAVVLIAIALGLRPWVAATGVGLVMTMGGGGVAYLCVTRLRRVELGLPRTRTNLKETVAWLKARAN